MKELLKIALPKGRLLAETASLLQEAGLGFNDYNSDNRVYHLKSTEYPNLSAKIFNEKDIPVQVAIGNYDIGICGLDWIQELLVKYPSSNIVKVKPLSYGNGNLDVYVARLSENPIRDIKKFPDIVRIASEYPNLAESFAAGKRIKRFSVFSLWGAAEAYPPENAEMVLIPESVKRKNVDKDLVPLYRVLSYNAYIIANRNSWETKNMSNILFAVGEIKTETKLLKQKNVIGEVNSEKSKVNWSDEQIVSIALPDGHQQAPTIDLLKKAGITIENYVSSGGNHRPACDIEGVVIKVIRPQDMPLQVANGNFDLAITGIDWLLNHLYQFPLSPVIRLLDLKYGKVRIVSVVSNNLPVENTADLRHYFREKTIHIRIASEYINIADKYARDNHLGMYRIVPTWGATETFIPDDADILIENTQTGKTLAKNNLKIIETLFESTACIIGSKDKKYNNLKQQRIDNFINRLELAIKEN